MPFMEASTPAPSSDRTTALVAAIDAGEHSLISAAQRRAAGSRSSAADLRDEAESLRLASAKGAAGQQQGMRAFSAEFGHKPLDAAAERREPHVRLWSVRTRRVRR